MCRRDLPNIISADALACTTSPLGFNNRTVVARRSKASNEIMGVGPGGPTPSDVGRLETVVHIKLNGMRGHAKTIDFIHLQTDVSIEHFVCKHTTTC